MANHNYFSSQIWIWIDFGIFFLMEKNAYRVENLKIFDFLVFKMFLCFSQFLIQFGL